MIAKNAFYDIKVPSTALPYVSKLTTVNIRSPIAHRRAVYMFAKYFRREFGYDFVQYGSDGKEDDETHIAYLWADRHRSECGWTPYVGAACFRYREYTDYPPCMAMQWVWLHPYCRRSGFLSRAWPTMVNDCGDFMVEGPVSPAMRAFLEDRGEASFRLWR